LVKLLVNIGIGILNKHYLQEACELLMCEPDELVGAIQMELDHKYAYFKDLRTTQAKLAEIQKGLDLLG
jgi:hypothetical protein